MQVQTHIFMANVIRKTIEKELSIKLDGLGFVYGNIKADLKPDFYTTEPFGQKVKVNHFKNDALPFLTNKIEKLLSYPLEDTEKISKEFSVKLGALTHYFSDFFCHAHTEHFTDNIYKHHVYELQLANYHNTNQKYLHNYDFNTHLKLFYTKDSILTFHDKLQKEYLNSDPSYKLDITMAIQFCASLGSSIILSCLDNELSNVA